MARNTKRHTSRKATGGEARAFAEECARMETDAGRTAGLDAAEESAAYAEMPDEEREARKKVDFSVLTRERMEFRILDEDTIRILDANVIRSHCLHLQTILLFYQQLDIDMTRELGNAMELILNQNVERFGRRSQRSTALFGDGSTGAATDGCTPGTDMGGPEAGEDTAGSEPETDGAMEENGATAGEGAETGAAGAESGKEGKDVNAEGGKKKDRPRRKKGCAENVYKDATVKDVHCEISKEELDATFGDGGWKDEPGLERIVTEYKFVPASVIVVRYHLHAYCPVDDTDPEVPGVVIAKNPVTRAREKSPISSGLMAGILHLRGALRVPVDRICGLLGSMGLALSPQRVYENLAYYGGFLVHLVSRLWTLLLSCSHIQADETPVRYYDKAEKKVRRGYFWVFTTSEMLVGGRPMTLFHLARGRGAEVLRECLHGYEGVVGSDGHVSYHVFAAESGGRVTNAGCLDHFRKKLVPAVRAIPGLKDMPEKERQKIPVYVILTRLNEVFGLERETKKLSTLEERNALRRSKVHEAFENLAREISAADTEKSPEGSYLARAVKYFKNQEPYLREFLEDGEICSNNSKCERKIAFFAVLRTQLKMFGSFKGAEVAALLETIEQTAREYMADTRLYYKFLIEKYCPFVKRQEKGKDISSMEEINDFLPWADNWAAYEKDGREKESILTTIARNI